MPRPAEPSRHASRRAVRTLLTAVAASATAGVLLAGIALPVVVGLGLAAKEQADEFLALPDELTRPPLATRSRILAADGSVLATLFTENRLIADLDEVPILARKALIAIEDSRFYEHSGVDYRGTLRAAVSNTSAGGVTQGGSTLTQQYVKNVLVTTAQDRAGQLAAKEVSLDRKLREARYALALEQQLSKDEILGNYLNIAYYGNGVYGLKTAAAHYFGKRVQELTLAEGALFAGMVQNPNRLDPSDPTPAVRRQVLERRAAVLSRMADLGYISQDQAETAAREPIRLSIRTLRSGCEAPQVRAAFFCDYVRRYLEDDTDLGQVLGTTREERQRRLLAGGLTIRTTLDPVTQKAAQDAVDRRVPRDDPSRVVAVADVVEPGTGAVRAMAVNRVFGEDSRRSQSKVNFAIGGSAGYQPGSTMKTFVLAQALADGLPTSLALASPPTYCPKAFVYRLPGGGCPGNAGDSESGVFDMVSGTHHSVNTYYIQLEERTGLVTPPALAEAMGVRQFAQGKPQAPLGSNPSFVLGTNEVSPLDMAAAYATFAARGRYCPPRPVTALLDNAGKPIPIPANACKEVLPQGVADKVTSILRGVIDAGGTGTAARIGRPAAGKTGTTNSSRAAWFIGYTPELATAVWVGKATPTPLRQVQIADRYYRQVYGGSLPAPIWRDVMSAALAGKPVRRFENAPLIGSSNAGLRGVPSVVGLTTRAARELLERQGFVVRIGPVGPGVLVDGKPVPRGLVGRTDPPAGGRGSGVVTLFPSDGTGVAPSPSPTRPAPASPRPRPTSTPRPGPSATPAPTPSPSAEPSPSPSSS